MVGFAQSEGTKRLSEDWHRFRQRARETATSEKEFSESDQVRYDLDTARIDGSEYGPNFKYDRPLDLLGENGTDVRDLENR